MDKAFFDTSMFLEPFKKKERKNGNYGNKAFALLRGLTNLNYERIVSASVLAECLLLLSDSSVTSRFNKTPQEIKEIHEEILKGFIKIGIKREAITLASDILLEDERITPFDALHFACAAKEGCKVFFFIDKELKENLVIKRLAKEHGMAMAPFDQSVNKD